MMIGGLFISVELFSDLFWAVLCYEGTRIGRAARLKGVYI
jgi:hypothetical protein